MIAVIGGGIIGTTTALALQKRGIQTTLIDCGLPGMATSFGNAGVLSESSIIVVNNPHILPKLPKLLFGKDTGLKLDAKFVLTHLPWILNFLKNATEEKMIVAAKALRALQLLSLAIHKDLLEEAGDDTILVAGGMLKLYRSLKGFEAAQKERDFFEKMGVSFTSYFGEEIQELEPSLNPIYAAGTLMDETYSVMSPLKLTQAYFELYKKYGGKFSQTEISGISPTGNGGWNLSSKEGRQVTADGIVIAAGPWSPVIGEMIGYTIPMVWERGYHVNVEPSAAGALNRPIHDVEKAYVMTSIENHVRVLSGVELAHRDSKPNYRQINNALKSARQASDIGNKIDAEPWFGSRPTMPDSLPVVGAAPRHKNIWFNFGHQHIGLSTSTGCAKLLADMIEGKIISDDFNAFSAQRFKM